MAAIVSGGALGLVDSSLALLGAQGQVGLAAHGRAGERVYLNAATGNLVIQGQDEILVGRGPDAAFLRTYNSRGLLNDDNGDNWRLNFHRRVFGLTGTANTAGSTVRRVDADGAEAVYTYNASLGKYVTTDGSGAHDTLSVSGGTWTFTDGDTGLRETYDAANSGRLTSVVDESGNTLTFTYNAAGLLTDVVTTTTGSGTHSVHLDYHAGTSNLKQIQRLSSGTQVRTSYLYDASNRLTQVTTDLTPANTADAQTYVTTYTYDGTSRRVASMTQSDGTSLAFTYVDLGGGDWRVANITDALGRVTGISYNTVARTTTVTDPLGRTTVLAYDTANRLTGVSAPAVGGVSQQVAYAYDTAGNVASVTDPKGNTVVFAYDANGNRVYERDAAGNVAERVYGSSNQLLAETVYRVPDPDGAGAGAPSGALTTRYVYDASTRLRFVVSAEGRVTEHRYDGFGQRVASVQYTGAVYNVGGLAPTATLTEAQLAAWLPVDRSRSMRVDTAYDFRGQVATLTTYAAVDAAGNGVAAGQAVMQFVYDPAGNLLTAIDARGGTTSTVYDGLGRALSTTDALSRLTLTDYQDTNRKTIVTLANGVVTTSTYSAAGELISVMESAAAQTFGETKYFYDADGRLRRTEDPTGVKTHILYDAAGRKVAEIDGDGSLTEYRYDANNNTTRTIRYANAVGPAALASLSNAQGVPQEVALASIRPAASSADHSSWGVYDAANRPIGAVDNAGFVTQLFYDGAGRLTDSVAFATAIGVAGLGDAPALAAVLPASGSADRLTRNFYDASSALLATLDGEGYLVEHKYDAAGRLAESVRYASATPAALRASGTLDQLRPAANVADIHSYMLYDAGGQVIGTVDGESYLTETVYDAAGNKTQVIRYATRVTYTAGATLGSLRPAGSAQDQVGTLAYDAANQLASETKPDGTVTTYAYDSTGKLVTTTSAAGTAEVRAVNARYDKQGRLTGELSGLGSALLTGGQTQAQIDQIWNDYGLKHTYDAAGRRTSTTDQLGNRTLFYYDADNRLVYAVNALGEVQQSVYNTLGEHTQTLRYAKRLSGATLASLGGGGLVNGAVGAAVTAIADAMRDAATSYAYDAKGNLQQTTDALGFGETRSYNAFGDIVGKSSPIGAGQTLQHVYAYDRRGLLTTTVWDPAGLNTQSATQYDAFGRAVQITDANGNVSTATYDKLGRVVATRDPLNALRSTTFDAFGRVVTQTDALGHTSSFAYDTANRSITVTTPEGVVVTSASNRHGEKLSVTDGRGNTTTYQYDKNGNLTGVTAPGAGTASSSYDRADRLIETVDARGVHTTYTYDAAGRVLTRVVDPGGLALTTSYAYDGLGQAIVALDANGVETRTSYDRNGQVVGILVDPNGLRLETTFAYDGRGKRLTVTEASGSAQPRVTQYAYDRLGRLLSERVDPSGLNLTTTYAYDKNGNVVAKTNANGNVTRFVYDANDRPVYTIDPMGGVTRAEYDAEGRVVRSTSFANAINVASLPANPTPADVAPAADAARDRVVNSVYDRDGRERFSIDALGAVVEKVYDASGNVVRQVAYANPLPPATPLTTTAVAAAMAGAASAGDETTRFFYDAANRPVYSVDAAGAVVHATYDDNGNVLRSYAYATTVDAASVTLAQLQSLATSAGDRVLRYVYDAGNRLVYAIDGSSYVKETRYDNLGRITQTLEHPYRVAVSAFPSLAEVTAALGAAVSTSTVNQSATQYANPVQPYTYVASANNDVQGTVTQNVTGSAQNTQVLRDPTQPHAYAASARNDVATPSTQAVAVNSASATVSNGLIQPYTFIGSAKSDSTSSATQNVALSVQNTSVTQSTNVANNAWYRSGTTLVQGAGLSIVAGSVGHTDNTPTGVRAKLFQNNVLLSTVNMDVGTTTVQSWQVPNAWDEFGNPISWTTVSGTKWNNVSGWTGQVNISTGTLTSGAYTIVLEAWDTAQAAQAPNTLYDLADGTWSFTNTINVNVGLVVQPTYVRWATSTQPAGTTSVALRFRAAGSTGAYTNATVGVSGTNHEANLGSLAAGNYEYVIEYRDTYGRLLKSAAGTVTSTAGQTTSASAAFSYTTYASTAAAGTSIRYFATAAQWAPVDHVNATVKNNLGNVVATAVTYPEAESGYNGEVNLKVGSALADGTYTVELTLFNKNGSTTTVTPFTYQVGPQTRLQQTISWAASTQPAGTTASFKYRTQGSTGAYTSAPIAVAGANQQVVLDFMPAGNYEYIVEYRDSYNRLLKNGGGTFTVAASGSTTTNVNFAYTAYTSTASAGSSISGYIALAQVPTIERVEALVKDYFTNATVSTATTYPEFEPGYAGNVNLKVGSPLATGRYNVTVTVFRKDGTSSAATFYYEVGQQQHWNPVQPSPYIASAKADTTSASTVAIAVSNATEFQSAVISNVGWTRSGSTLVQAAGRSVVTGTVTANDLTPTLVRATIFQGTTQVAQVTTDVGSQTTENWQVPVAWDEYGTPIQWRPASGTRWSAVSNWNRQANLSASLAPGHYRIVFEARDDAQAAQVENTFYDLTDATWTATNTLNDVVIGTITQPTVLAWAASTQPAGTTSVSFGYRAAGSTGAYTNATVTTAGTNQQVSIAGLANGNYEYQIEYRGSAGQLLKYSRGNFTSTQGGSSSVSASFTAYTSASGAGSSIRYFTAAAQWTSVDRVSATVKDPFGNVVSTALTYPEAEAGYNGEVNLKVSAALADGRYTVELTVYNKNGTTSSVAPFLYEVGERSRLQHTLSWPAATQPAGTTPRFTLRPQGSTGGWASAAVTVNGANQQVLLDWIVAGSYEFKIEYRDSFERVIKSASGTLTAAASGASSPTLVFSFDGYTSTPTTGSMITGYIPLAQVPAIASVQAVVKDFVSGATVSTATTLPEFEPAYAGNVNLKAGGAPLADGRYNVTVTINRKDGTSTSSTFYYEVGPQPYAHRTTTLSWSAANQPSGTTVEFTYGPAGQAQTAAAVTYIEENNTYQVSFVRDNDDGVVTGVPDGTYDYTVRYKSGNEVLREGRGQFVANASSSSSGSLSFAPNTATATYTNQSALSGQLGQQQLVQPSQYIASAKADTATPASQAVALAVSNATEFQSAVISNVGWTRSGSTLVQGAGRSVVAGTVTATDLTPTLVRATIFQGATQVAQVTTDVGAQSTESWQVANGWDEYGNPISWTTVSGTRWNAVSNWNRQANLSASLAPGHYRIVFEARDDAQAAQAANTFYDYTDGTWTATNTLNDVVIGTITQPTVLAWAASTQPAGTASVSFEYRTAGSTGVYSSATVGTAGASQQVSIAGLANGSYEYRIQYKDSYGRVLKSSNGNFTSTQGGSSSVSATFNSTTYASSAAAGSSIRYFTQASQWAPVDHVNATVKDTLGNVVATAVTYPEAESGYNGEVNLKVGAVLADGRYSVELTIYSKNGSTSTIAPFVYEVGPQPGITRTTTVSFSAANKPAAANVVEFAYTRAGQSGETVVTPVLVNGSYQAVFIRSDGSQAGLADGIYDYTVRYKQGATVVSLARGQFAVGAGESGTATLEFTPSSSALLARVNTFAYDHAGRLIQSSDPLGAAESYTYDALGNKTSATNKKGAVWTYAYDQAGRVVDEFSPPVAVTSASGTLESAVSLRTHIQYDALGNVLARTEAYGRPEARTTQYQYDARGLQVRTTFPTVNIYNPAADNLGTNSGATINRTESAATLYSEVSFDTLGRAVMNRAADGTYSYKVYDADGRLRYDIDAEHFVTEYRYDAFGNQTAQIRYAQRLSFTGHATNAAWTIAQVGGALTTSAQDRRIDKIYDRDNRLIEVVEPQVYVYDAVNNTGATAARRTRSEYNAFDEVVRLRELSGVDAAGNPAIWADLYKYFDARGLLVAKIDAEGYLCEYRYDAAGNLIGQVEYAKRAPAGWSAAGYAKPPAGDADSGYDRVTAYAYDLADRLIAETRVGVHFSELAGNNSVRDATPADLTATFGYDAVGNRISVTDPNGNTTYTYFDALGRTYAVSESARLTTDPARGSVSVRPLTVFGLDVFGKAVRQTNFANGAAAASASGFTAGAASGADQISTNVYDAHGNLLQSTDAEGGSVYLSYDAAGRVAKSWQPSTERNLAGAVVATQNRVQTFQYDALGNQLATVDSSTRRNYIDPAYPAAGNLSFALGASISQSASFNPQYDEYGNLIGGWQPSNTVSINWGVNLAALGGGEARVVLTYAKVIGGQATQTFVLGGGTATGATLTWNDPSSSSYGITSISSIQLSKKDAAGNWVVLHSGANGSSSTLIGWQQSTTGTVSLAYRANPGAAWTSAPTLNFGAMGLADLRAAGSVQFETRLATSDGSYAYQVGAAAGGAIGANSIVTDVRAAYNAFGEITSKSVDGRPTEYFEYDGAGHLWRTNQSDGVDRVYLYDVQGKASASISSLTADLKTYASAAAVDTATRTAGSAVRTETQYDRLERAVRQELPAFGAVDPSVVHAPVVAPASATWTISNRGNWTYDEYGAGTWNGTDVVNASWSSLAGWGSGDIQVQADITTAQSGATSIVQTVSASTFTGTTLSIAQQITSVTRLRVWKKDTAGAWVLVRDSQANNSRRLTMPSPVAQPGDIAMLRYKPTGTTTWSSVTAANFGALSMVDTTGWANGTYDYEVQYKHSDGSVYSTGTGTLTLSGATASITPGSAAQSVVPVIEQTLDRWGNVLATLDPRFGTDPTPTVAEWETRYRFDEQNRLLSETSPQMLVQDANGGIRTVRAVTRNFYDRLGNTIGIQDPNAVDADTNNNGIYEYASTARYNAAGQLTRQINADGGVVDYAFDVFGRQTGVWDERNYLTVRTYDRKGRLTQVTRPDGTTEQYRYDELDNRPWEKDGRGNWSGYAFDAQGQIIRASRPNGQSSLIYYDQLGRKTREVNANGDTQSWQYDKFNHLTAYSDLAGTQTTYTYNRLGQVATQNNAKSTRSFTYDINGALKRVDNNALSPDGTAWWAQSIAYQYDVAGNRTRETFTKFGTVQTDAVITYDAWNRVVDVNDIRYHLAYTYDANGNRRHTTASYYNNAGVYVNPPKEYWYTYDRANRILLAQGVLSGGNIVVGSQGTLLSYDAAGNRVSAAGASTGGVTEAYFYDVNGRLVQTNRNGAISNYRVYDGANNVTQSNTYNASGVLTSFTVNTYDANGWLTQQQTYKHFAGTDRGGNNYALSGLSSQTTYTGRSGTGQLTSYSVAVYNPSLVDNGYGDEYGWYPNVSISAPHQYTNTYSYSYLKFGGSYLESVVNGTSTYFQAGSNTTRYDGNGAIYDVSDQFQATNYRSFLTDHTGRILQKTQGAQTEYYFYAGDRPLGATGANGTGDFDFNYTPVTSKPAVSGGSSGNSPEGKAGVANRSFGDGSTSGTGSGKEPTIYDYPAMNPSGYVVSAGETLRSIAQAAYGDGALWYLIADANGISSDAQLKVGMELKIPNRVTNLHNNHSTFKPYEPGKIIGDTTPTLPDPPPPPAKKGGGCGGFGIILMVIVVIVAVVLTVVTAGIAAAALAPAGATIAGTGVAVSSAGVWAAGTAALSGSIVGAAGVATAATTFAGIAAAAIGGAVGSIASQGLSIAFGLQEKFSWGQVAAGAIGAGITSGIGAIAGAGGIAGAMGVPKGVAQAAVNGALNNVITQGVNILVGVQDKFDWRGVAAGAVSASLTYGIDTAINGEVGDNGQRVGGMDWARENPELGKFTGRFLGGIAGSVARSVIRGGRIDLAYIAADAFGNAVGQAIVDAGVAADMERARALEEARRQAAPRPVMPPPPAPTAEQAFLASLTPAEREMLEAMDREDLERGQEMQRRQLEELERQVREAFRPTEEDFEIVPVGGPITTAAQARAAFYQAINNLLTSAQTGSGSAPLDDVRERGLQQLREVLEVVRNNEAIRTELLDRGMEFFARAGTNQQTVFGTVNMLTGLMTLSDEQITPQLSHMFASGISMLRSRSAAMGFFLGTLASMQDPDDTVRTLSFMSQQTDERNIRAWQYVQGNEVLGTMTMLAPHLFGALLRGAAMLLPMLGRVALSITAGIIGQRQPGSNLPYQKYQRVEYDGRRVYKNTMDIDPGRPQTVHPSVDPSIRARIERGETNLDLMRSGNAPIGPDGRQMNLHHILGLEPGPMVELTATTHQQYYRALHGLVTPGNSFRNTPGLESQYNAFRRAWWRARANDF